MTETSGLKWYAVDRDGAATLCANEEDARQDAASSSKLWPNCGPYIATRMLPIDAPCDLRARAAWHKQQWAECCRKLGVSP